jgi:alanine dehydrogenase
VQRDAPVRAADRQQGLQRAAAEDPGLAEGINLVEGRVTHRAVAESLQLRHEPLQLRGAA